MATDSTQKALNICTDVMTFTNNMMQALEGLIALEAERAAAGVTLSAYDTAITNANSALKHATGSEYQSALTSAGAVKTWIDQQFHSTNFDKVRP